MHQGRDVLYARLTYCLYLRPLASCCCCRVILLSAADVGMTCFCSCESRPTAQRVGIIDPEPGLLRKVCPSSDFWASIRPIMCAPRPQLYIEHASCEYARGAIPRGTHVSGIRLFLSHRKHTYQLSPSPRGPGAPGRGPGGPRVAIRAAGERAARSARPPSGPPRPSPQRG